MEKLTDISEVAERLAHLRDGFDKERQAVAQDHALIPRVLTGNYEWKFSNGDYFDPLPYEDEAGGYAPPRLLKKKYQSTDEASLAGMYASAFNGDELVAIRTPTKRTVGVINMQIFKRDGSVQRCLNVDAYPPDFERKKNVLRAVNLFERSGSRLLDVGVGQAPNFSVTWIELDDRELPRTQYRIAYGWKQNEVVHFEHDELGKLKRVLTYSKSGLADIVLWQAK
jgi:hypothetical protein